jgi:murein DD-endopeptidase MepM/ murein hydrolase activator NlpD
MTLFIRCIAVLTVLLGLALMVVSAYAAQNEAAASYPDADTLTEEEAPEANDIGGAPLGSGPGGQRDMSAAALAAVTGAAGATAAASGSAAPDAAPTPTVELHYPVPAGAAPATNMRGGRGNLSAGPRVWRVPSIRPGAMSVAPLPSGGLDIPADQLAVMQQVALATDVPWQILAAIARVESDFGRNMSTSWAGAIGYGQFLPESWAVYGNGGDPYDFNDVLPAMARYLLVAGAPDDMADAIYAYNHLWSYVAQVLSIAASYGYVGSETGQPQTMDGDLIWPAMGAISSYFSSGHQAIDIDQTATPGAPVLAAHDGVVLFAGGDPCCSYGYYVILVGPSGITTLYAHLETLEVTAGQTVRRGQSLGPSGSTGYSTGPHLHFELIEDGERRNPLEYLP